MRSGTVIWPELDEWPRETGASVAEIKALAEDIRDNGLRHPVLVNDITGEIIDGLRRVEAHSALGWSVVPAVFVTDPIEAGDVLEAAREGRRPPLARGVEIVRSLRTLLAVRRAHTNHNGVPEKSRDILQRALGIGATEAVRYLAIESKVDQSEVAREVLPLVREGKIKVSVAYNMVLRGHGLTPPPPPLPSAERTELISNIIRAINTATGQFDRVGGIGGITDEAVDTMIANVLLSKKQINKALNELRRKRNQ